MSLQSGYIYLRPFYLWGRFEDRTDPDFPGTLPLKAADHLSWRKLLLVCAGLDADRRPGGSHEETGTTDVPAATRFAREFFGDCVVKQRSGEALGSSSTKPSRRFDVIADQWLDQKKTLAGSDRRKLRAYNDARKLVTAPNGLGAFFIRIDIGSISTGMARDYLCFAAEHSKLDQLATTTQRNHLSTLNAILKFAAERRLIVAAPAMPRLRLKDNPRPCFQDWEINELCQVARRLSQWAIWKGDHPAALEWQEIEDFVIFMVSTFLRAGEWKELRQRHCRIVHGEYPYLEVVVPNGKTHKRKAVSMPEAIPAFQRIVERDGSDPDRFLFKNRYANRETAKERMPRTETPSPSV